MKNTIKKFAFIISFIFISSTILLNKTAQAQCPMCKAAVESSMKDKNNTKGKGLNRGILYLLAMPYLLAGVTGAGYYYRYKKRKKNLQE